MQAGSDEWFGLAELSATQFNVCVVFFLNRVSRFVFLSFFFFHKIIGVACVTLLLLFRKETEERYCTKVISFGN